MPTALTTLPMWVVYKNPLDVDETVFEGRDRFLGVRWEITAGHVERTQQTILRDSLEAVREAVRTREPDMGNFGRMQDDDPVIVEVWI